MHLPTLPPLQHHLYTCTPPHTPLQRIFSISTHTPPTPATPHPAFLAPFHRCIPPHTYSPPLTVLLNHAFLHHFADSCLCACVSFRTCTPCLLHIFMLSFQQHTRTTRCAYATALRTRSRTPAATAPAPSSRLSRTYRHHHLRRYLTTTHAATAARALFSYFAHAHATTTRVTRFGSPRVLPLSTHLPTLHTHHCRAFTMFLRWFALAQLTRRFGSCTTTPLSPSPTYQRTINAAMLDGPTGGDGW